jgi:predicted deacylase
MDRGQAWRASAGAGGGAGNPRGEGARSLVRIGTAESRPGEVVRGVVPVAGLPASSHPPVAVIAGREPGPTLLVMGGVHGAEYTSIEAARRAATTTDPAQLRGVLAVIPIVSVDMFWERGIYVHPFDGKNPNRQYPGKATGTATERLAAAIFEQAMGPADYVCDLHGGDMVEALEPFTGVHKGAAPDVLAKSLDMARAFGIEEVIVGETVGSTYGAAAMAGKPAILCEAGGQGILSEAGARQLADGVRRLMQHLGMLPGEPERLPIRERATGSAWLTAPATGLWYPVKKPGDAVREGELLGRMTDVWGAPLRDVLAPATGRLTWIVTAMAMKEGQAMAGVARD